MFHQVHCFCCAAVDTDESFQNYFHNRCGVTFNEATQQASAGNITLIILDSAQGTYDAVTSLWECANRVLNSPITPQWLMILIAASHGTKPLASMGYPGPPIEYSDTHSILLR